MKLDIATLGFIQNVVDVAKLVNVDGIIIEPERVRGMDEARTVVVFQDEDVPLMGFGSIGLNRIDVFTSRINIVKIQDQFTVEATIDEEKEFVRSLTMKAKGTKIDYRCASPATIQAPRIINDELIEEIQAGFESIVILQKSVAAMGNAELVTIVGDKRGVSFELEDINGDVFDHTFGKVTDHQFSHKYPVKTLLALLKENQTFMVGKKGMIKFDVNGIGVYVLPKV